MVKNSHYISHFALRNWRHPRTQKVTIFNFASGAFEADSTRDTYVADVPFPADVESWLDVTVEGPLGEFVARCKRTEAVPGKPLPVPPPTEREWKAISLWVLTQAPRTALAQDPSDTQLIDLVRKGEAFQNDLVRANHEIAQVSIVLPARERLYFPDVGLVALPLLGGVGFFVPLHPRLFAAVVPRAAFEDVDQLLHWEGVATALSAGLTGDRIVIPPMADGVDRRLVEGHLRQARASAQELTKLYLAQNRSIGIDVTNAWKPPPIVEPDEVDDD